jgi:1,2-phenylacetyl-CoA epoxidase PaaB subunit
MIGIIEGLASIPKPTDANREHGAKLWLVPSSDINCATTPKNMTATPNYARYLFSGVDEYLRYDYLGD